MVVVTDDTSIGGVNEKFPATHWSAIHALHSTIADDRTRAFDAIIRSYWKPVYKYLRFTWNKSNEDAKDLTQAFFTKVMEKDFFSTFDPHKARFRTYLRVCLDGFVANEAKAGSRLKRGGDAIHISMDFASADTEFGAGESTLKNHDSIETPDHYFEKEWIRELFGEAVHVLKAHCEKNGKGVYFALFEAYDLSGNENSRSYQELALDFEMKITDVTNYLAYARREFRRIILTRLKEMTATDQEFREEARALLGVEV